MSSRLLARRLVLIPLVHIGVRLLDPYQTAKPRRTLASRVALATAESPAEESARAWSLDRRQPLRA